MKTAFIILFLLVIGENLFAQTEENYRSRNYKLNRNYLKDINSRKHRIADYKSGEGKTEGRKLKSNRQKIKSSGSKKVAMGVDHKIKREEEKNDFRNKKSTLKGTNKKSGKQLVSYITMILTFSLILVNK